MTKKVQVGDTVKYSRPWLRSIGQYTGDLPRAVGTVTALTPLGDNVLAEIDWKNESIPKRVITQNLIIKGSIEHV